MPQHKETATVPYILALLGTTEQALQEQGVAPLALAEIYNDYLGRQRELTDLARLFAGRLLEVEGVCYVGYRVKAPLHLLQKILRKEQEYPDRIFTPHTYLDFINDLVGVRALHLYKDTWRDTGRFITQEWGLKRAPYAYINQQEDELLLKDFATRGCRIIPHPTGYKAVHYVIKTKPGKQRYFAEIQLRTFLEESWSEIDHSIRYPDHICSKLSGNLLSILNRLTSHADEMATFIRTLAVSLGEHPQEVQRTGQPLSQLITQLEKLPITEEEKQLLRSHLSSMMSGRQQ